MLKKGFFSALLFVFFVVQAAAALSLASQVQKCRGRFVAQCWPEPAASQSTYVKTVSCQENLMPCFNIHTKNCF